MKLHLESSGTKSRAREMPQSVKLSVCKPEDMSVISRNHISQSQTSAGNPSTQEVEINRSLGSWPACLASGKRAILWF